MNTYVATFYTHLSAQVSWKRLRKAGCEAQMMPVPRVLSSSCGTCVGYEGEVDHRELLDADAEALYEVQAAGKYRLLWCDDANL